VADCTAAVLDEKGSDELDADTEPPLPAALPSLHRE
jgi:hypothetical protein